MSDYERVTGKLKLVDFPRQLETLEQKCEFVAKNVLNKEKGDFYKTYEEFVRSESYRKTVFAGDNIFEIEIESESDYESDYCHLFPQQDGTLNFVAQYYNGGTCLDEVLEEELNKLKNKD